MLKLLSLAFLLALGRAQDQVALIPKDCEYTLDIYLFLLTGGEISQYTTTDRCNYADVRGEDGEDDTTISWMYECENNGDMTAYLYDGTVSCSSGGNVNSSSTTVWEDGDDPSGKFFACGGVANCAVRATVREPCSGNTDLTIELWPAKDICIGSGNASLYYQCDDIGYGYALRDNQDCGIPYSLEVEVTLYENGCDDDTSMEIKCNSASRAAFSIASFVALLFAFIR